MGKSAKKRLIKAHKAFMRMFPNSFCYKTLDRLTGEYRHWLHLR